RSRDPNDGILKVVHDVKQTTRMRRRGPQEQINSLYISALDDTPVEDFINETGFTNIRIPDLYAGDVLYSAVNLQVFAPAHVNFELGDVFSIVNGVSPQLPGMVFGTQPINRDESNPDDFLNPAPFTGMGEASTLHQIIPEPATLTLLGVGALVLLVGFSKRKG